MRVSRFLIHLFSGVYLLCCSLQTKAQVDGDNETFYIENLDPSLTNEVTVFNAVHQIVYHQENYRNNWEGGNLPVGTIIIQ